jgi:hypothetical protein
LSRITTRRRVPPILVWIALLALFVAPQLAIALETALHFNGSAIDGPFQLYNALRRIAAGYRPGIDFQFFHGLGVPYVYYWLFDALGGRFRDSEMAREMVTAIIYPLSLLVVFRGFSTNWTRAVCATAGAMAATFVLKGAVLLFALNSMVGLRSTLPAIAAVVIYRTRRPATRIVATGVVLGLALFVSTEQGLAALAAYIVVSLVTVLRANEKRRAAAAAGGTIGIAILALFVSEAMVAGFRGAAGALRYNFRLVPMDQYWYFGVPPSPFIPSWSSGFRMLLANPMMGLAILLGIAAAIVYLRRLWRTAATEDDRRAEALAFYAAYGLVSCASLFGIFIQAYSQTCWRVVVSLAFIELLARAERGGERDGAPRWSGVARPLAMATVGAALWALVAARPFRSGLFLTVPHVVASHVIAGDGFELAGVWPRTLAADDSILAAHRAADQKPPVIWSTYAGWFEARAGVFHPSFDYLIHALGPENRGSYLAAFRRVHPEIVQTVRPTYSQYEPWIENETWGLYRDLLQNYEIRATTPWSFVWEPRATPLAINPPFATGGVAPGSNAITLPPVPSTGNAALTLLEIDLRYHVANPLQRLPVLGPMPRYLVGIEGAVTSLPVSLDPFTRSMRFPVIARPGQTPTLRVKAFSLLPGARVEIDEVTLSVVPLDAAAAPWLRDLTSVFGVRDK